MNYFISFILIIQFIVNCTSKEFQIASFKNDESCQQEIQDILKNVNYTCKNNTILIQDQDEVEFDFRISEFNVTTQIQITNIQNLIIKSFIVDRNIFSLSQSPFIEISNIKQLTLLEMNITSPDFEMQQTIFKTSSIDQLIINHVHLNGYMNLQNQLIKISASNIDIQILEFKDCKNCFTFFEGLTKLKINRINIEMIYAYDYYQIYNYFQSNQEIYVIDLYIYSNYHNDDDYQYCYALFQIIDQQLNSTITIEQIQYKTGGQNYTGSGQIQFKFAKPISQNIIINSIDYEQIESSKNTLVFLFQNGISVEINRINLFGFNKQIQQLEIFQQQTTMFVFDNIPSHVKINQIIIAGNSTIYNNILNLSSINLVEIKGIECRDVIIFCDDLMKLDQVFNVVIYNVIVTNTTIGRFLNITNSDYIHIENINISNIKYTKQSIFWFDQVQKIDFINQSYSALVKYNQQNNDQTYVFIFNNCEHTQLVNAIADLNYQLSFTKSITHQKLVISGGLISNGYSIMNGGCLDFTEGTELVVLGTVFQSCSSQYFGGAIFGGSRISEFSSATFINCSSQIGGGLYQQQSSDLSEFIKFKFINNTGYLCQDDYSLGIQHIDFYQISEFNSAFSNTSYYISQVNKQLYQGLYYIIQLKIQVNNTWYNNYKDKQQRAFLGNFQELLNNPSNSFISSPAELAYINYPYLLWHADQVNFQDKSEINIEFNIIFKFTPAIQVNNTNYQIQNGCNIGMEKIFLFNSQFFCRYCDYSKGGYDGTCQTCEENLFSWCYANYTLLREGYWRQKYTLNQNEIEECSINPQNCKGGDGIKDSLCYDGHIGAQCLDCDIHGKQWNQTYTRQGLFACTECSSITNNALKIIFLFILMILSIFIIIVSNFKRLTNQIYAQYLNKMGIFFIGTSLYSRSLTSTYAKILLFHISIYTVSNYVTKIDIYSSILDTQISFYNPLNSQFFSVNCFLVDLKPESVSIGYAQLITTFFIPFSLFIAILLILFFVLVIKMITLRKVYFIGAISFIYLFMTFFYSTLLELCLSGLFCLRLTSEKSYSLIDLSLECNNRSPDLLEIQTLSAIILVTVLITIPLIIFITFIRQRNNLEHIGVIFTYGFLYNEYKSKYYYWEIIRFILKILFASLNASLKSYTTVVGILLTIILFFYFAALQKCQPFISLFLNNVEKASIFISILILQSSIMYQQFLQNSNSSSSSTSTEKFALYLYLIAQTLNMLFIIYLVWLILSSFFENIISSLYRYFNMRCCHRLIPQYSLTMNNNIKKLRLCINRIMHDNLLQNIEIDQQIQLLDLFQQEGVSEISEQEQQLSQLKSSIIQEQEQLLDDDDDQQEQNQQQQS